MTHTARTDQDREDLNLADLILEPVFLFGGGRIFLLLVSEPSQASPASPDQAGLLCGTTLTVAQLLLPKTDEQAAF